MKKSICTVPWESGKGQVWSVLLCWTPAMRLFLGGKTAALGDYCSTAVGLFAVPRCELWAGQQGRAAARRRRDAQPGRVAWTAGAAGARPAGLRGGSPELGWSWRHPSPDFPRVTHLWTLVFVLSRLAAGVPRPHHLVLLFFGLWQKFVTGMCRSFYRVFVCVHVCSRRLCVYVQYAYIYWLV